jgi:limonene-1,2-epoxide hydrolase
MLIELTKQYISAFSSKNLEAVAELLSDGFVLEDQVVKRVEGKTAALDCIKGIFDSCSELEFAAKNIFQDGEVTIIEFTLKIDDTMLQGTDIIEWENDKICELRAYLDIPK